MRKVSYIRSVEPKFVICFVNAGYYVDNDMFLQAGKYNVGSVIASPGRCDSPLHGQVKVVPARRVGIPDPTVLFASAYARSGVSIGAMLEVVPEGFARGWRALTEERLNNKNGKHR